MNTPRSFLDAIGLAVACPGTQLETHCIMCGYGNGIMANFCADCGEQLRGPRKPLPQPLPSAMELGEKHEIHLRMDDRLLTSPDAMLLSCSLELLADTELYRTVGGKTFAAARRDETKLNIAFLNTHDLCLQKED